MVTHSWIVVMLTIISKHEKMMVYLVLMWVYGPCLFIDWLIDW